MNLKKFITSRGVILATIVSVLYGCLIFTIYFTGYQAMPKHVDELTVTVVNRNKNTRTLADQIEKGLPFKHIKKVSNLRTAKKQLNNKKTAMIIEIPWNFKSRISSNSKTNLNFYIDEATPYSQVSALKTVSQKIGYTVNQQVIIEKGKAMLLKEPMTDLEKNSSNKTGSTSKSITGQKTTDCPSSRSSAAKTRGAS
ncbi:ABC transporter permease [Lentilactobacillus hilgardii]|uniref:ABC transporter permease n=1 Tax=Lentilactobacillus hilgardii TaxID=1588 RepID=UPI0021C2A5D6|nr:ABC transporter permease [Lentilactobacillus hilgardii]